MYCGVINLTPHMCLAAFVLHPSPNGEGTGVRFWIRCSPLPGGAMYCAPAIPYNDLA
jgi:hypothetical protein